MLRSFFKICLRNLARHRIYTFINLMGLGTGIAASIFILLWIGDEISYDDFHENGDRIYSVMVNTHQQDREIETYPATPALLKDEMLEKIPQIEAAARYSFETDLLLKHKGSSFQEKGIYADPAFFSILSFPILKGNSAESALPDKGSIAISEALAKRIFQNENPIGKTISLQNGTELAVSEVFEDVPENSSLQFDFVLPFDLILDENPWMQNWQSGGSRTVVLLREEAEMPSEKIHSLISENCRDCTNRPFLFLYQKQHLHGEFENGIPTGGRIQQVYLFSFVAFLILAMACINFMNLSTARSVSRSKEVGVRKSVGASKWNLMFQFIGESLVLTWFALIVALMLVQLLMPVFNEITEKSLEMNLANPLLWGGVILLTLVTGLMAGSYPAWVLAQFNPSRALKGESKSGLTGAGLRKALVVAQFAASVILILGSIVVYQQIQFISNRNLGFDRENVIVINQNEGLSKVYSGIKNELQQVSGVEHMAFGGNNVFTVPIMSTDPQWLGKTDQNQVNFKVFRCDDGFLPTLDIPLIAGRNFVGERDSSNYLINRKAAEEMGLRVEEAVGTQIDMWHGPGVIVGVTEDFHNDNLKFGIQPMIMMYSENLGNHYLVRLSAQQDLDQVLARVEDVFREYNPEYPFEFSFLNEVFDREYRMEQVIGKLSMGFTILAILISCLGLFGLSLFTAEQRAKEIGVRKVLGASVGNLVLMLYRDFGVLVGISLFIGVPIAWLLISNFLSGYTFHTSVHWSLYVGVGVFMFLLTLLSVGFHSLKVALSNPVKSLHSEG